MHTERNGRKRGGSKTAILLTKGTKGRDYDDVIDAAYFAASRYGSAANALANFARESPTMRQVLNEKAAAEAAEGP